jgi:hypothetical protein
LLCGVKAPEAQPRLFHACDDARLGIDVERQLQYVDRRAKAWRGSSFQWRKSVKRGEDAVVVREEFGSN